MRRLYPRFVVGCGLLALLGFPPGAAPQPPTVLVPDRPDAPPPEPTSFLALYLHELGKVVTDEAAKYVRKKSIFRHERLERPGEALVDRLKKLDDLRDT